VAELDGEVRLYDEMKLTEISSLISRIALVSVFAILAFSDVRAAPSSAEKGSLSLYDQAVANYIDGASKEVAAFRAQIDAVKDPEMAKRFATAKEKLASCEATLEQLKTAARGRFDPLKAEYERNRTELLKELEVARKP
jgi:Cu/Ag efflux protein CusF